MVTVAGAATDCFLMAAQIAVSGIQVCAEACSGVSFGNSLFGETHRGSISPTRRRSPFDSTWMAGARPPKSMSTRQRDARPDESRNRNVGAVISGGKIDSSPDSRSRSPQFGLAPSRQWPKTRAEHLGFFVIAVMPRRSGQTAERHVTQLTRIGHPGSPRKWHFIMAPMLRPSSGGARPRTGVFFGLRRKWRVSECRHIPS